MMLKTLSVGYKTFLFFLIFFVGNTSMAQVDESPWRAIQNNDFVRAKSLLEKQVQQNPANVDALCGLIFIAETIQDYANYKKYTQQLIEKGGNEEDLALFYEVYDYDPAKLLKQDVSEELKMKARLSQSDSLIARRKFKKSRELLREGIGLYDWSIIGPFTNIAGSGIQEVSPVEKQAFSLNSNYENEAGFELRWLKREQPEPDGIISYFDRLPGINEGTYFANTFIEVPSDRLIQFRVARTTPTKIWLDDQLIFEAYDNVAYDWDLEYVTLNIPAGWHRILVKQAPLLKDENTSNIYLDYNDKTDEGDGFTNDENYYDDYRFGGSYNEKSYNRPLLALRLTDEKGQVYRDLKSAFEADYQPGKYEVRLVENNLIEKIKARIQQNEQDLKQYYLLCKAYQHYEFYEEAEAYFVDLHQKNPKSAYFRYLLAKCYAANNKGDKAESLINGLDEKKTPLFAVMAADLKKIDKDKNEPDYLVALDKLYQVSPTNWDVVSSYLDYFGNQGKTAEKRSFIEDFLLRFPDDKYQKRLEPYLEDDSYKPSSYVPETDKERDKRAKEALKNRKKRFVYNDYREAISYYKRKKKEEEIIKLHQELIELFPSRLYYREQAARYLFEKDRLDETLEVLEQIQQLTPYDDDILELMGDVYIEKDDKERALDYYQRAMRVSKIGQKGYYAYGQLQSKIDRIIPKSTLKDNFQSPEFASAMEDGDWKERYKEEESLIRLYTIEAVLNEDNEMDYHQKLMISILNEAGAKYWTEANFSFLGELNFVKVIKADGTVTSPNRNWGYVVFQNLEPGDVIQIEGQTTADMTRELPGEMVHIMLLSYDVPIYKAAIEFITPKDQELNIRCNRLDCQLQEKGLGEEHRYYRWDFEHVAKREREMAAQESLDSYAWLMVGTLDNWSEVVKWYLRKTYRRLESNYEIDEALTEIIKEGMTKEEKVRAIYNYLTREITYSYVSFLNSNYIPKKPSATIAAGIGDCKDVASLMMTMLNKVGIPSYYVLLRSHNYTDIKPEPSITAFNHVIVGYDLGDGELRYLDMTTDYYPDYVIPESDAGAWGLVVKEGVDDLIRLPGDVLNSQKSQLEVDVKAAIHPDRSLTMDVSAKATGVMGGKLRESLNRITTPDDRLNFLLTFYGEGAFDYLSIDDFTFEQLEDISAPLGNTLEMKAYNHLEKVSDFYIIRVPLLKAIKTDPVMFSKKRYNNLNLALLMELVPTVQNIEMSMPESFQLMGIPEDIRYDNPFGTYELKFTEIPGGIKIHRLFNLKKRFIDYKDFEAFKQFYLDLLDADRTKLAIRLTR